MTWLGSDLPLDAWDAAVQTHRPDAVVLAAPMAEDVRGLDETVRVVTERRPGVVVAVGGAHQDATASTCRRLGHRVGPAARELAEHLS